MKACRARHALAGLLVGLTLAGRPAVGAAQPAAAGQDDAALARAAIRKARAAIKAQDYPKAIEFYEQALRHQPAAKTHFNLGVCHHRLMASAPAGSPAQTEHRSAAVDAYNRYLQAAPQAGDREQVAEMIRGLGGTPWSPEAPEPWTIDLVNPEDVPDPPSFEDEDGETDQGRPSPEIPEQTDLPAPPGPLLRPRWGLGFSLPLHIINPGQAAASDELRVAPTLGLGLSGHAFLGERRRLQLGGEAGLSTQTVSSRRRHRFQLAFFALAVEMRTPIGRGHWEIGGGGSIGVASQALMFDGEPRLRCAGDREAGRRSGLWTGARLYLAALVGKRRDQAITFRLGPGLGMFRPDVVSGMDADGMTCEGEPSAFTTFGIDDGPAMVVGFDLGYGPRF